MALSDIITYKRALIAKKQAEILGYRDHLKKATRSLERAIRENRRAFICEIKRASPSMGLIRNDIDVMEVAQIYGPFASAISVLADEKFFQGSLEFVRQVSLSQECPILCKDVVVSPWQIYEARHYGADAVLLMLSVLSDAEYLECRSIASSLNMDHISEVHTKKEMERACALKASIIGINNRDLKSLAVDLDTAHKLLPMVPDHALVIVESGIYKRADIQGFDERVDGFLIGTSLMRSPRIDLALRELMFGRVKICGLTNNEDAWAAYRAGGYYGGLNFSRSSKRFISSKEAQVIKDGVPLVFGGIFVDQSQQEIVDIVHHLELDFVQLHGHEDDDFIMSLRAKIKIPCEIWKAIKVTDEIEVPPISSADRILLDSFHQGQFGGTGRSFDWQKLAHDENRHQYIVAGGINVNNVQRLSELLPFAIDIASGAEDSDPRKKSLSKLNEIFSKLRP